MPHPRLSRRPDRFILRLGLLLSFVLLRSVFLSTLENPEPRCTLKCYPILILSASSLLKLQLSRISKYRLPKPIIKPFNIRILRSSTRKVMQIQLAFVGNAIAECTESGVHRSPISSRSQGVVYASCFAASSVRAHIPRCPKRFGLGTVIHHLPAWNCFRQNWRDGFQGKSLA